MATFSMDDRIKSRESFHAAFKESVDADLTQVGYVDNSATWHTIRMFTKTITSQYLHGANSDLPKKYGYELDIRELWNWIAQAARYIAADHPAQDRLVAQVLHAREMGNLSRKNEAGEQEVATTSDGNIWSDLPFLVEEVQSAWKASDTFPSLERHNLSAFIARLTSVGIRDPGLGIIALWILRDTLETDRPLTSSPSGSNNENLQASIADLLPAANAWFLYCGYKVESLCIQVQDYDSDAEIGELARRANATVKSGFSVERWRFWRDRLEEISRCEDEEVAQLAEKTRKTMKTWGERIESMN
jgi:hypothetical protein